MITQEMIKEYFNYNKITGIFMRIKRSANDNNGLSKLFCEAGTISTTHKEGLKYRTVRFKGKTYKTHRLIWLYVTGYLPVEIDHEDGNGLNNKWCNLRNVSTLVNAKNHSKQSNNTSGVTGVTVAYARDGGLRWKVRIGVNGKRKVLGWYKDFKEACSVRAAAEIKYGYHKNHGR